MGRVVVVEVHGDPLIGQRERTDLVGEDTRQVERTATGGCDSERSALTCEVLGHRRRRMRNAVDGIEHEQRLGDRCEVLGD